MFLVLQEGLQDERRLCRECAAKLGYTDGKLAGNLEEPDERELVCARCGQNGKAFQREPRLGCSECVRTFKRELIALWRRSGRASPYAGKVAGLGRGNQEARRLRDELALAVQNEDFERAATLRDRLRDALEEERP